MPAPHPHTPDAPRIDTTFHGTVHLRGTPGDQGLAHGRLLADLLTPDARGAYLDAIAHAIRLDRATIRDRTPAWFEGLMPHVREEIDGMARGARVSTLDVAEWLFADIAARDAAACTALVAPARDGPWVARNCDWLVPTLMRGTSCVVHETPNRIPTLAVGIHGDIDVDTGANAERLWIHVHTLYASDTPRPGADRQSWLFWVREALETCASLDDLERMLELVHRDRGIILVAVDGKTHDAAVYECERGSWRRAEFRGNPLAATNHCQHKHPDEQRAARSRGASTIARLHHARRLLAEHTDKGPLDRAPDTLRDVLAHERVEMRTNPRLTTIYAAACNPAAGDLRFASGAVPAASAGTWRTIPWPF